MEKSPPEIRILPDSVANKIAAGEVIERPAAVVKELLENSIDAGASRVDIEFKRGGKSFIKVSDDGCGMTREQALMSLELHATSKIRDVGDIFKISSYGFRGEAVPSIAGVSSFTMKTRPKSAPIGTQIFVDSGKIVAVRECGMAPGTEIVVENLFAPVPARRKFLKTDNVEASHIVRLCRLYALALPHISLTLAENSRVIFRSEKNTGMLERVRQIFGGDIAGSLALLPRVSRGGMAVGGAILAPGESYPTSRNICAFINSRPVECKAVFSAVKEAYSRFVPKGRFAAAFLFLELPPASVDVNVHPAKREVRLSDEFGVRDFLIDAISNRLAEFLGEKRGFGRAEAGQPFAGMGDFSVPEKLAPLFTPESDIAPRPLPRVESAPKRPVFKPSPADDPDAAIASAEIPDTFPGAHDSAPDSEPAASIAPFSAVLSARASAPAQNVASAEPATAPSSEPSAGALSEWSAGDVEGWRYIGHFRKKFVLFETKSGLEILNVSAALRRICYARIMASLGGRNPRSQLLLMPATVKLDRGDAEIVAQNLDTFAACGFKIEDFGGGFYRVSEAPAWLDFAQVADFVRDFVQTARDELGTLRRKKLARESFALAVSARAPFSGGDCLSPAGAAGLLRSLLECAEYASAPDGKPTVKEISLSDFTKMFNLK